MTRRFKRVDDADRERATAAAIALSKEAEQGQFAPTRPIPDEGRWDRRPLIHGFRSYAELFNARQLFHLTVLGRMTRDQTEPVVRRLLSLAFSEHLAANCMYTGYAFGYRRTSPLFSIHGYRHVTRPVELNPWLNGIGRGTFLNAVEKIAKAVRFAEKPADLAREKGRTPSRQRYGVSGPVSSRASDVTSGVSVAAVETTSSEELRGLRDASVDLVLTDPPYFDNISYSELSDFYLAWHQVLGTAPPPYDDPTQPAPVVANLAASRRNAEALSEFSSRLSRVFAECRRVLRPSGVCVFTFHHPSAKAWEALATALHCGGLRPTAVLPMRGEGQGGLHTKSGTIKWDAVLVCRPHEGPGAPGPLMVADAAIVHARAAAEDAVRTLGADEDIGFRDPDGLNYYRALVVASAAVELPVPGAVPVEQALRG